MSKDTGGPAFPFEDIVGRNYLGGAVTKKFAGMSIRDAFAAKAMQTIVGLDIVKSDFKAAETVGEYIARKSYQIADAMLAERAK